MANAIFQFFIGDPKGYRECITSVSLYCKKYGIEHYVSTSKMFNSHIMFEKYQLLFLAKQKPGLDKILYVDADILVTPHASNIFESYSNDDCVYAYDENDVTEWMDRDKYVEGLYPNWPITTKGKKQYINAGVMLFPTKLLLANQHIFNLTDIPNKDDIWYFGDQTILNYWLVKNSIPVKSIDYKYNRMDLGNFDPKNLRYEANFIHYAGPCKYGNGNKIETMISDFKYLYGN